MIEELKDKIKQKAVTMGCSPDITNWVMLEDVLLLFDELNINKLDSLETAIGEYLKYQKRVLVKYQCELLDAEKLVSARRAEVSRLNIIIDELSQILDESND